MSKIKVEQLVAKIDELSPTENNPRQISKQDFENLKKSMKDFPEMREIRKVVVDENNRILGGHMRIKALKELGESEVPIDKVFGLTEKQKERFVIQDNIQNGEWDMDELANSWSDLPLDDWGIGIEWDTSEQEVVEDEVPEVDDNEPAESELGGVYQLGRHRLMCGDSTDAGSVAILMDGQKADLLLTDPPYNVEIVGGSHAESVKSRIKKGALTIQNDKMSNSQFSDFLHKVFEAANLVMKEGACFYVWYASREVVNFQNSLVDNGLVVKQELIWNKNSLVMGRQDYQWKHEPCLYGWKEGASHNWYGNRKQTTVIDFDRPVKSEDHPTMKPVELFAYQVTNSTTNDDVVLDLFGGSGTTLIACEQLGRTCYMMELDPKYCDVIRKRYWKFKTGSEEGWEEGTKEAK